MELGVRPSTRQSWQRDISIRIHIKEIQDEHPRANEEQLVRLLVERMREDDDALIAAAEYAVHLALLAQRGYQEREEESPAPRPRPRPAPTPAERAAREAAIDKAVKEAATQILLLNQEMPNGKRMRYCTGNEMGKFGKGYQRIAKRCKTKTVGSVLNEKEVRQLILT
jgi:hypothetical protein